MSVDNSLPTKQLSALEQLKFTTDDDGNVIIRTSAKGSISTSGLSTGGRVSTVTLNDSTWTEMGTLSGANTLAFQNRSANNFFINFDTDQDPNGEAATAQDSLSVVTFTADNVGTTGNSISLVFNGIDDITTVVGAWNTANPANTVSHDGTGTDVLAAQTINLSGGLDAYTDGWRVLSGGEFFFDLQPVTIKVYGLAASGSTPTIHIMGLA